MAGYPYPPAPQQGWPPPPPKRRFPWLAVLGSAALALILIGGITAVLIWDRDDEASADAPSRSERTSKSEEVRKRLLQEGRRELPTAAKTENAVPGYDYSTTLTDVATDTDLLIPASYDADGSETRNGAEPKIEVYSDAALTRAVPIVIVPDLTAPDSDPRLAIKATELRRAHIAGQGGQLKWTLADLGTYWNLNPTVFVVQHLTPDGDPRPRPLVTEVRFESQVPAPAQVASSVTADGDALLEWSPVDGASEYLVVLQQRQGEADAVRVVGRTGETTWTSAGTERCLTASCTQNEIMKLTTVDASTMASAPSLVSEKVDARLGVVAVVEKQTSILAGIDFTGLESLPVRADRKWDAGAEVADRGLAALPSRFLFVSVDGSTRATGAFIERSEVRRRGPSWEVPLRGQGTRLVDTVNIPAAAVEDMDAAVARFNERAERDYPQAGLAEPSIVINVDHPEEPSPELPAPDYPISGSNELTRFIAGQLIAGSTAIDISALVDQPGMPDAVDAWKEAVYQNPYALAYFDRPTFAGDVIHVEPAYSPQEKQERQRAIARAAESVVRKVTRAGMSDAEKVSALNRHLVDFGEYDDAAIAALSGGSRADIPARFRYAWETDGILVDGDGVCMSYSYAFQALAEEAGVESVVVTGDLADGGGHAWNKVRIEGSWRNVDVTWNDPEGGWTSSSGTAYLMIGDADFTGSAQRTERDDWMADAYLAQYASR
ncbi:transglutaminase domain-containing protein [Nocardioides dubius]|uniref:Transglutaminase domain-containing protein n=1 Tax=Nocardioides dubius TaxID=317019 RepID=A0ABN1TZV6_9ACTN